MLHLRIDLCPICSSSLHYRCVISILCWLRTLFFLFLDIFSFILSIDVVPYLNFYLISPPPVSEDKAFFLSHLVIFHNFAVISLPPTFHLFLNLFLYYFIPVFFYLFFFLSYLLLLSFFIPFSFFPVFFFFSNCCCSLQISYNPDASYCYTRVLIKEYHLFRVWSGSFYLIPFFIFTDQTCGKHNFHACLNYILRVFRFRDPFQIPACFANVSGAFLNFISHFWIIYSVYIDDRNLTHLRVLRVSVYIFLSFWKKNMYISDG